MANGAILWEGKSQIDGAPIMLIATGLASGSVNSKTGALVQTWILRADVSPVAAIHTGADESICGACPHRGTIETQADGTTRNRGRACYVAVFQAPRNVWETAKRGKYPRAKGAEGAALLAGLNIRLGAYGDPAAIPFHVWKKLLSRAYPATGYTHQWRKADSRFASLCMASADSVAEAETARALGYRTFRVGSKAESIVQGVESLCPASAEAGKRTTCESCKLCGGDRIKAKSIFIPVHGTHGHVNAFEARKESAH